ncbi:GIY-YIG nuclease family protein [Mycolicibacterium hippocampi]|uniref:GIY-YIG nuclease family protein n=1 Tax=Mycolicibacterium hippocampi TaxID=659824 RepID=UPI0035156B39
MEPDSLFSAPCRSREEVLTRPCPVPKSPGVYGWWFRRIPGAIDLRHCEMRDGLALLYTGISPSRPPANGKPPSTQSLFHRIRYHYTGNAEGSTLRKTLGVLLADELGIQLRRVGSGMRRTFGPGGEAELSRWMAENALVSWVVRAEPWVLEAELIARLNLPLNLQGNAHNSFYPVLKQLRAEAEAAARSLPIVQS